MGLQISDLIGRRRSGNEDHGQTDRGQERGEKSGHDEEAAGRSCL
jgi:hypothetical protein